MVKLSSDAPVPMYQARHRGRISIAVDPTVPRSRPNSGRPGAVACVQNRRDEDLGKPTVLPKQELEVARVLEPKVLPKREPKAGPK